MALIQYCVVASSDGVNNNSHLRRDEEKREGKMRATRQTCCMYNVSNALNESFFGQKSVYCIVLNFPPEAVGNSVSYANTCLR